MAKHEYSSTQLNLPAAIATAMRRFGASIPDSLLAEDGREKEAHVTVKYGLHSTSDSGVRKAIADESPVTIVLGKISLFRNDDADVVKVGVQSPGLRRLNQKISTLPNSDTHPDYQPHATIAYLKPGKGAPYAGKSVPGVTGKSVTADAVVFSSKSGNRSTIPLEKKKDMPPRSSQQRYRT